METSSNERTLEQLVESYRESKFNYLKCPSKKITGLTEDGEPIYSNKLNFEVIILKRKREQFENLQLALVKKFRQAYQQRKIPEGMIGADRIAGYAPAELYQIADELIALAKEKNDPQVIMNVLHTMELPFYYRAGRSVAKEELYNLATNIMPKLAVASGTDTSIYFDNMKTWFCALGEPATSLDLNTPYSEGVANMKARLKDKDFQQELGIEIDDLVME